MMQIAEHVLRYWNSRDASARGLLICTLKAASIDCGNRICITIPCVSGRFRGFYRYSP
jgi:hypothetical protein